MSTSNGFGTMYYGWRHNGDGAAVATKYVVALFLPLIPLACHRLRLVHDPDDEPVVSSAGILSLFSPHKEMRDEYEILEVLPLDWGSVAGTYARTYIGLPLMLGLPLAVPLVLIRVGENSFELARKTAVRLNIIVVCVWMAYFFAALATLLHRARGGRK